jgi:D-aminopeptidase
MAKAVLTKPDAVAPYDPGSPCEIEVELAQPEHADVYRNRDGIELTDARTVTSRANDWWTAWRRLYL